MNFFRTNLFFTLFFLFTFHTVSGQRFDGGFKGGLAASEVSGDNLGGPDKFGWFASVFTKTSVGTNTRMQLELMYIQKGSRSRPNEKNNFYDYRFNLQYAEIPVVAIVDFSSAGRQGLTRQFSLEAGLSVSFLVGTREVENELVLDLSQQKPYNDGEINILLGLYYPVTDWLDFHLRFSQGVTPIRPHLGGAATWYNQGQYNTVWTFGLSWSFL